VNWDVLGAVGDFVGGIAVVISLIYVGFQVRQNSNSVRAASHIAIKQLTTEITNQICTGDMARVYVQGLKDSAGLAVEDRVRFNSLILSLFGAYEAEFYQRHFGTIPSELQSPSRQQAQFHLRQPGVRHWWDNGGRLRFSRQFVDSVERDASPT